MCPRSLFPLRSPLNVNVRIPTNWDTQSAGCGTAIRLKWDSKSERTGTVNLMNVIWLSQLVGFTVPLPSEYPFWAFICNHVLFHEMRMQRLHDLVPPVNVNPLSFKSLSGHAGCGTACKRIKDDAIWAAGCFDYAFVDF